MGGFHGPEQSHKLLDALEEKAEGASSENEEQAIRQQMAALDRFFNKGKIDAKFKIELQFGKDRSSWKPFAGAMSLFLSGTKLHGGGDEKLYFCPREDCDGVVFPNDRIGSSVVCRNCQMQWDEESLVGERLYRLTSQNWAEVVTKWFRKVELNADIYLKYHPMDIRSKAAVEVVRQKGGELLNKARNMRGLHIYPLKNIIKDVNNGSALADRFKAFINA